MKPFLNWIILTALLVGALGFSPQTQNITVTAQSAEPPSSSESPEPLILPFAADETAAPSPSLAADPAATEPPPPAPFSIHLETSCDAWGQTARLTWSLSAELAGTIGDRSEILVQLPPGLQPLEGMEIAPDGFLHLPASIEGGALFNIQPDAAEPGLLEARLLTADAGQASANTEFTPGAYARLTPEGGRVEARAMGISLEIPPGTLAAETALCIGPLSEAELPTTLSGRPFQLNAYNLEKGEEITRFDQYLAVQVNYNPETYTAKASQLKLFYFNRDLQDWAALPTEVDEESHTLTGYTDHFTPFDIKPQSWESARLPTLDGFAVSEFTGAAAYTYPLQLPAGAGGWQPSLALTYNSQVVDSANSMTQASWAGMGWSLDTGYIQRNMGENVSYYGPQDPNGSDADIRLDDDTGHDGDDTFSLVLNGQSWRLLRLPDQDNNSQTVDYRTENESFWRIRHNHAHITSGYVTDNSTWEVWDKTGNHYTFSPLARYPVGCYTPFLLTWQWPLTSATNVHSQTITYTYSTETEVRSATSSPSCDSAYTQVAIYPATINYSGYQVVFDRSARYDHKAAWDTDPDSRWQTIFFQRSRLAAIRILSQNGSNWELVRKYTLTQQDGVIFPNLLWNTSVPGSKTPTLVSISEYGSDGTSALPETTFSYDDDMHLTTGSNGYGGSVTFDYEPPWYEFQTSQDPIREYSNTQNQNLPITASIGGTLDVYDPGQMYKIELKVWPTTAVCTAGYYYTVSGSTTWVPGTLLEEETPSGATYKYMRWASFYSLLNPAPRFYFSCTGGGYLGQVKPFYAKAWPLVNRYRVTAKTAAENHANTSSSNAYTYTGAASNNPANSTPGTYPLSKPRTTYRGHSSVTQVGPENLAVTTWYGQGDETTGLPLAQLTALQQVYDDFDALDTGAWSYSHYGTRQTIVKEEGEPLLKMESGANDPEVDLTTSQASIQDADSVIVQFKLVEATGIAEIYLQSGSLYWGIRIKDDALTSGTAVKMLFDADGDDDNTTLMNESQFSLNTWYVLMLTAGAEQFTARIWQRDDPLNFYQYSNAGNPGNTWKVVQSIQNGTLYLDDYREGPAYGLQLNQYAAPQGYSVPTIVPPYLYPGNYAHTDLAVRWLPLVQTTTFSLGESGRFTGVRQTYQYDPAYQGNAQYGNQTHLIEAVWTEATPPTWSNYRMTLSGYYPSVSLTDPVKNLVGLPGFSNQYKCENDSACTATNTRLLGSTWYLYDSHTSYSQQPTVGVLTGQRSLLYWGNPATPSDPYYLDQDFTYDAYGNLATSVNYATPGSYSTRSTSNPRKSETIYDSQHHAFPVETRAYYNTSQYYATTYTYDYRLGVPTSITGPNGAATIIEAGYDVFGRITWLNKPGDDKTTNPTMRFSYNWDDIKNVFWTQAEQLISGSTYYKARKFYNGLGQLVQSQVDQFIKYPETPEVPPFLQTVVTNTTYNNLGLVETQTVPYASGVLATGYLNPISQPAVTTVYDELGRVNTITQPDNSMTVMNYKIHLLDSQPASVTYTEDANNNTSEAWADAFGRLLKSQGAAGPAVSYTYDAADHLTSALYGNALTNLSYDIAGRKLTLDDPDMGLWSYAYDALGNLTRQTDARGQRICLYYDGLNRLTGKHYRADDNCPSSPTYNVSYGHDAVGHRTSMTDTSGSTTWTYTARGLLESETKAISGAGTFATKYTYNSADLPTNMQYPADNAGGLTGLPSLTYTYLPQMALDTLGSYVTGTMYDAAGRVTSRSLGSSGLRQDYAYTAWNTQFQGGKLDTIKAGTAPNYDNLQNLDYGYDKVGNILTILDATNSSQKQCFTYDALDRLTRGATTNDTQNGCGSTQLGNGNYDQSYTYDTASGNLSSKAGLSYSYNDAAHDHAVTHLGGVQKYWYDANGNQVTRIVGSDTYNLAYDAENRLVEVKKNNNIIALFVYDGDGNRVKSTLSTVTTAFVGNHTEWDVASSSLTRYYYAGATRVAMRKNNTVYYLLSDHLGSTSLTTDQNGQNPVKQLYLPWGEVRYTDGTLQTKYTYTGQYSNVSDFGLMYYNARWYDSALGRFTSADTIVPQPGNPLDWDRYSYVRNTPINYTDPSGHMAWEGDGGGEGIGIVGIIMRNLSDYYGWSFSGKWSYHELKKVQQGANDIVNHITSKGGNGQRWVNEYLGGVNFAKETIYHYPIRDMDGGWTSLELSTNAFLHAAAFVFPAKTITFQSSQVSSENVVHELGHVLDNYFGPSDFFEAVLFGGGAADGLVNFLGGNPGGIRARGNQIFTSVNKLYRLPGKDYGNTSVADFFAQHFMYQVYGYPSGYSSNSGDVWMEAFIGVTINLAP